MEWYGERNETSLIAGAMERLEVAIETADADRLSTVRADLRELAEDLSDSRLSGRHWPEYGALLMNLRNVVASMHQEVEKSDKRREEKMI